MGNNSFISLYRKYRPRKFDDFVGHEAFSCAIKQSLLSSRLHHAILINGTRGVGKTTIARIISMSINCVNNKNDDSNLKNADPCLECGSCKDIINGNSLDVLEIDAASNTGVDFVKELIENASCKPLRSKYKIFIIDEVHMLSKSAFNALLKTLEEPSASIKFIFATTEIKKIPITILSRCQKFYLKDIDKKVILDRIKHILTIEGFEFEEKALNIIVKNAKGSMRDALSILDKTILSSDGKKIDLDSLKDDFLLFDISDLFYNLYLGDFKESHSAMESLIKNNISIESISEELIKLSTDLILEINNINNEEIKENEGLQNLISKLKNEDLLNMPKLIRMSQIISNSMKDIKTLSKEASTIMLISKICYGSTIPTPIEIIKMSKDKDLKEFIYNTSSKIIN